MSDSGKIIALARAVAPKIDPEAIESAVSDWLDDHPITLNYVTPEQYGAVGDGVADDSQAVQDACDAGYNVYFASNKTYYLADTVTIDHDCHLHGGENTVIKTKTSNGTVNNGIVVQGTLKKTTTMTGDYKSNGTTGDNCNNRFTLSDMQGIGIGDIMVITAEDQYYNYARQYYYLGATLLITDIYDNHIYSCDAMPFDITNSQDVSVKIYEAPIAVIENIKFVSDLDGLGAYSYLLVLDKCKNSVVRNCDFSQMANGMRIMFCVNTNVDGVSLSKSKYDNTLNGDGYGIVCGSSTNTIIERVMATCGQHAISLTGTIPLLNTYVRNCNLTSECRSPGLDTHESVCNTVIEDCVLGTAALNGTVRMNRCRVINNRRFSDSGQNISVYGSHNAEFSSIRIENTVFYGTGIALVPSSPQNPIRAYDNVFGSIEIENCTGGYLSYNPGTNQTILSNTINRLSINNWNGCREIYHTGAGKIKESTICNSTFTEKNFINDHNPTHGVVTDNIEILDVQNIIPFTHKVSVNRNTHGEKMVLPKNVSISLSSNNASAKFVVCGANLTPNNASDFLIGTVTGDTGESLSRSIADSGGSVSFDSSGNLVYTQPNSTSKYAFYPVGMFYAPENSNARISATIKNTGGTSAEKFDPMIAIVDCGTGLITYRGRGTPVEATSQGAAISHNYNVSANSIVLCYFSVNTAVANAETTFEDFSITCTPNFAPAVIDQPYEARRLTGDGTILSLDGVNNIMSSELTFNVSFAADYTGNPIGLLPAGTGVSF